MGESQLKEQVKTQWERLDVKGHNLINGILTAGTEEVQWPANTEPKFQKKKTAKMIRLAYDTKTKWYIYNGTGIVASGKPIRLELSQAFLHFCYHPDRKECIKVDPLTGREVSVKYIVTVAQCHWICERNFTVIALLAYATERAQVTGNNFDVKYEGHQNCSKTLCMHILRVFCYHQM